MITYTTKREYIRLLDLIVNLRKIYQQNNRELDGLKENVYGLDSRIKDFFFYINQYTSDEQPEIMVKFIEKRGPIWRFKDTLAILRGEYDYYRNISKLWTDYNQHFKLVGNYPAKIQDEKQFAAKIERLLASEFYKNIHTPNIDINNKYLEGTLNITETGIYFYGLDDNGITDFISYNGREDTLEHRLDREYAPNKRIIHLFNTLDTFIKTDSLPEYHQQYLDDENATLSTYHPLDDEEDTRDIYLVEEPEPKRLILRKR